jgi:undecaprenyl-diphosphatase
MVSWSDIIVLSIVEGITEFIPVSSTGHMIIAKSILGLEKSPELDAFMVIVQAGAILSVLSLFWPTFLKWIRAWGSLLSKKGLDENALAANKLSRRESLAVAVSPIPFAVLGYLNKDFVKSLFSTEVVAYALIAGGILILVSEALLRFAKKEERETSTMTIKDALLIGVGQCFALWPGFSRSAATLIMGRMLGFSRSSAAEMSFLIGLPTLLGTASYEAIKEYQHLQGQWLQYLLVGTLIAWIVGYICVKSFVAFLKRYSISGFAWYRIIVGILLLVLFKN